MSRLKKDEVQATDINAPTDEAEYLAAVERGKAACASVSAKQWELGDLAATVTKRYGENRLERFAIAINFPGAPCTLGRYRSVCLAFPKTGGRPRFFASAQILQRHDDRIQIVTENPNVSVREAREIMRKWRAEHPDEDQPDLDQAEEDDPIEEEDDTEPTPGATISTPAKAKRAAKEKQRQDQENEWLNDDRKWFKQLVAVANEASRVASVLDEYSPEQLDKLRQAIDPKLLMYVRGGGRMLFRVANRLAELLGEDLEEASAPIERAHQEATAHAAA